MEIASNYNNIWSAIVEQLRSEHRNDKRQYNLCMNLCNLIELRGMTHEVIDVIDKNRDLSLMDALIIAANQYKISL